MRLNPFEKFYKIPVQIGKLTGGGGYSDSEKKFEVLDEIKADVQPYSGGLAQNEYGFDVQCQYRMYCAQNEHLAEGNVVQIEEQRYLVVYVSSWEMGEESLLKVIK